MVGKSPILGIQKLHWEVEPCVRVELCIGTETFIVVDFCMGEIPALGGRILY